MSNTECNLEADLTPLEIHQIDCDDIEYGLELMFDEEIAPIEIEISIKYDTCKCLEVRADKTGQRINSFELRLVEGFTPPTALSVIIREVETMLTFLKGLQHS